MKSDLPEIPFNRDAERGALGCVLLAGQNENQAEADALLLQLRPNHFWDLRHRSLHAELAQMRMDGHALEMLTVKAWLDKRHKLGEVGGMAYLSGHADVVPNVFAFSDFRAFLEEYALRRWCLNKMDRLKTWATSTELTQDRLAREFSDLFDESAKHGLSTQKLLDIITPKEARAFEPDASDFLVGEGLLMRGMIVTIGGEAGVGKSRLATTLAVAGARGFNYWQGYPVRSKFRTLILQTENAGNRLKEEFAAVPEEFDDCIRVSRSLPKGLAFGDPKFCTELQRIYDLWPFDVLVIDPWNDASAEDGQADYKEVMANIRRCFLGKRMPCVVIVAHLRKPRAEGGTRRKTGRELLHELSGSLALGSTSRTVFVVQAASSAMDDDRIVFEVAKANDAKPEWLKEFGIRSAWHRKNGAFERCHTFDWDTWDNPDTSDRRAVTRDMVLEAWNGSAAMKPADLAKRLHELFDVGQSTAFRAIGKGGYLRSMLTEKESGDLALRQH